MSDKNQRGVAGRVREQVEEMQGDQTLGNRLVGTQGSANAGLLQHSVTQDLGCWYRATQE